ncbi:membrane-spanning 4-domains subfamily A member 4A-like [Hoplias malabaricus]|uniref:membrane-spanning 4-domains subfamily A member 4A-like n=1 Tax=Hoplias malabaricus TaxID=27720 RepID=UPI003462A210
MIGITTLLFGIVLTANLKTVSVISGVTIWGPVFYITTGALAIAAENKAHPSVVRASLAMNVISSVIAGVAIIFLSFSLHTLCSYSSCSGYNTKSLTEGANGVLMVFSVLEIIISIYSSVFICRVTCCLEIMEFHKNDPQTNTLDEDNVQISH